MVKMNLFCLIVGDKGSTFSVKVKNNATVDDVKKAVKKKNDDIDCDAKDLQLFLTKKNGEWLTENDVKYGWHETNGYGMSATQLNWLIGGRDIDAAKIPIHVLEEVPSDPTTAKLKILYTLAFGENPFDEKGCLESAGRSVVIYAAVVEIAHRKNTSFQKLVKEQYFYSGGTLREFCKKREELEMRVARDCRSVDNAKVLDLVYNYGVGQSKSQVDRVRRHYVTNYHKEKHYYDSRGWKLSVDSGYVLSELGRIVDMDKQLEIYKYAKSVGAGFYGVVYEQLLPNAVHGAYAKRKPIVLKIREGSEYEKIEIRVPNVVCSGEDETSRYPYLSTIGEGTYWYPNYPFFPFVDAVTTCKAFSGKRSETIEAFIQVTIRSEKKFKEERLRRLNEEINKKQSLKDMKRAFVVADTGVCERFNLHDAPDPKTFLAMTSCFSPEQLEHEVSCR
ncbi:Hypothetical protein PHPALM_1009 [Phytophthora palmivora]|uniref:Crinkler effector protein N-terminal domain-containing protein n=1 Tax=Phytophthora palmivora TaxID=4796 RepID=A0A2P4YTH4_9STRA|nr:Hypothetical protein PHPALM_1009 [Phytophthora palmivora]